MSRSITIDSERFILGASLGFGARRDDALCLLMFVGLVFIVDDVVN